LVSRKHGGGAFDKLSRADAPARSDVHHVSALTGEGIPELIASIECSLVPIAPPAGAAVAFTTMQVAAWDKARGAIERRDGAEAGAALQSLLSTSR
jgi:hypothetical protein